MKRSESPEIFLDYCLVGWGVIIAFFSAVVGAILCTIFAFFYPQEFGFAYLTVYSFFVILSLGALFWILLHHAVDAAWSVVVRRIWEHLACLLLPLIILGIPLIVLSSQIWNGPPFHSFFSPSVMNGLLLGAAFLILAASAECLWRASIRSDDQNIVEQQGICRRIAFASIPCYAIGFALISLLGWMSLQRGWISAVWPVYFFAGSALSSLALTIVIVVWLLPAFSGKIKTDHFHLLGKLLFAFTLFWAYIAFSQYLIIWYANLPMETSFFCIRAQHRWSYIMIWVLVIGHFIVPFLLLLSRSAKAQPKNLAIISVWLLAMQLLDFCWILLPSSHGNLLLINYGLLISLAAVGGALALIFLIRLGSYPLWPVADSRLKECFSLIDE